MRKLRRLPWRIPKSHHSQPGNTASAEACPRVETDHEARREAMREALHTQPVAFSAGRYVAPVSRSTEIRRKARHRTIVFPLPVAG